MNTKSGKILIVDDDIDVLLAARLLLKKHVAHIDTAQIPDKIPALMEQEQYDVILLDMNFTQDVSSGREGFKWLKWILKYDPKAVVVLITAYGDVEMAVKAVKKGATDFVLKPWQNEKLIATVSAALKLNKAKNEVDNLRSRQKQLSADLDQPFRNFIGDSPEILNVFNTIRKVAKTDANVLILGENGTGKELVAREMHRQSNRSHEVFICVDMGAVIETLFESELFGHAKGSFTDANEDRAGRFEVATGGTLFLDEICNLPLQLQAKLLSVLENRRVMRVGLNISRPIDVRLICATNMPIYKLVERKKFRQDLLYRINTVEIEMPPLRERPEDIPLLVEHFLKIYNIKYHKNIRGLNLSTMKKLLNYHWPGNVRELHHAMERAVIMSDARKLKPSDFLLTPSELKVPLELRHPTLRDTEKEAVQRVIERHDGNITHASRELGITRTSLYRRLEKYGL